MGVFDKSNLDLHDAIPNYDKDDGIDLVKCDKEWCNFKDLETGCCFFETCVIEKYYPWYSKYHNSLTHKCKACGKTYTVYSDEENRPPYVNKIEYDLCPECIQKISKGQEIEGGSTDYGTIATIRESEDLTKISLVEGVGKFYPSYQDKKGEIFNNYESNQAIGLFSHAEGNSTTAYGDISHAEGVRSLSSGISSHAEGNGTTSYGDYSHAEGSGSRSIGIDSHSEGNSTTSYGDYSHAEGVRSLSSGISSHAEGNGTTSYGDYSHAEGIGSISIGICSHAEGNTTSYGDYSHAEGSGTTTTGNFSHAEGCKSISGGQSSHAEGNATKSVGNFSHAEGDTTKSEGQSSHAEGNATQALANFSHAEGDVTKAKARGSHAEGGSGNVYEYAEYSHVEGLNNNVYSSYSHVEGNTNEVGVKRGIFSEWQEDCTWYGTDENGNALWLVTPSLSSSYMGKGETSHAEGVANKVYANVSHIEGNTNTIFIGCESSHAEGVQNKIYCLNGHIEGDNNIIGDFIIDDNKIDGIVTYVQNTETKEWEKKYIHSTGINKATTAHAEGVQNKILQGQGAHVEGVVNTVSGHSAHAEGNNNQALNFSAHVEGNTNIASGEASHAEGNNTRALGTFSHTEGDTSIAGGDGTYHNNDIYDPLIEKYSNIEYGNKRSSHAEGNVTKALGFASHAEGDCTVALGQASHAEGDCTVARNSFDHAEGSITYAVGGASHAEGSVNRVYTYASHVEGCNNIITFNATSYDMHDYNRFTSNHAEGNTNSMVDTSMSHVECNSNYIYRGRAHHAEGIVNTIGREEIYNEETKEYEYKYYDVTASHVEGCNNVLLGNQSHVEGDTNYEVGFQNHVEGVANRVNSKQSHVEGTANKSVNNKITHIEGTANSVQSSSMCHVEGSWNSVQEATLCNVRGTNNICSPGTSLQTVLGKWNIPYQDSVLIIGDGTGDGDKRHNLLRLGWNAHLYVGDKDIDLNNIEGGSTTIIIEGGLMLGTHTDTLVDRTTFSTEETPILKITFHSLEVCNPAFIASVQLNMDRDGVVVVEFYINSSKDPGRTLRYYYSKGDHCMTIFDWLNAGENQVITVEVRMHTEYYESDQRKQEATIQDQTNQIEALKKALSAGSGYIEPEKTAIDTTPPTVRIEPYKAKGMVFSQGISTEHIWDGLINIYEGVDNITIEHRDMAVNAISVLSADVEVSDPYTPTASDTFDQLTIAKRDFTYSGFYDHVLFGEIVKSMTLNTLPKYQGQYNATYVYITSNNNYALVHEYVSKAEYNTNIDEGYMMELDINTSGFETLENVVIESE